MATCIGTGTLLSVEEICVGTLGGNFDAALILEADLPNDTLDTDLDAVRDRVLIATRFADFSSNEGEADRFFPPTTAAILFDELVGSTGRLAGLPPLIFSANIFLQRKKVHAEFHLTTKGVRLIVYTGNMSLPKYFCCVPP